MEIEPYLSYHVLIRVGVIARNDEKNSRLMNSFQVTM